MTAFSPTAAAPTAIAGSGAAPSVPTNLAGVGISAARVTLTWTASIDLGSGVGGYRIYRDTVLVGTTTALTFTDTGLTTSTSYDYQISAIDTSIPPLESAKTAIVAVSTLGSLGNVITLDSSAGILWTSQAYSLNDVVNSTDDTDVLSFECTTAGTSGGTEPTWPVIVGGTVVDGGVTWTARTPKAWEYAMVTASRAINAFRNETSSDKFVVWGEKNHWEKSDTSSLTISSANAQFDSIPSIYRVDKTTNLYSPSRTDGSNNVNFGSLLSSFNDVKISTASVWYGFRFESADKFFVQSEYYAFEDCVINYGTFNNSAYFDFAHCTALLKNTTINATNNADSYWNCNNNAHIIVEGCIFNISAKATGFYNGAGSAGSSNYQQVHFNACDMSGINTPILIDSSDFSAGNPALADFFRGEIDFSNCYLPTNYEIWDGTWVAKEATYVKVEDCSDDGTNTYINERRNVAGSYKHNIVTYRNSGYLGSEDADRLSLELIPTSLTSTSFVISSEQIGGFFSSIGTKVITLQLIENYTSQLTKADMWLKLYYFKGASNPFRIIDLSSKEHAQPTFTVLPAGSGLSDWSGEPTASRSVKIEVTVDVGRKGSFYGVVELAKYESGKQVFIDPEFTVS